LLGPVLMSPFNLLLQHASGHLLEQCQAVEAALLGPGLMSPFNLLPILQHAFEHLELGQTVPVHCGVVGPSSDDPPQLLLLHASEHLFEQCQAVEAALLGPVLMSPFNLLLQHASGHLLEQCQALVAALLGPVLMYPFNLLLQHAFEHLELSQAVQCGLLGPAMNVLFSYFFNMLLNIFLSLARLYTAAL
jgi:hypothetical protein